MMTTVPIILVIVVWLFILAPWLLRSPRPMSHTGEAFEETRVLFEGDSGSVPGRRKPRLGKADIRPSARVSAEDPDAEYELVLADDASDEDSSTADAASSKGPGEGTEGHVVADTIDGEVVETPEGATTADSVAAVPVGAENAASDADAAEDTSDDDGEDDVIVEEERIQEPDADVDPVEAEVFTTPAHTSVAEDAYDFDETFTSPVDLLYPGAIDAPAAASAADTDEATADAEETDAEDSTEFDDAVSSGSAAVPMSEAVDGEEEPERNPHTDTELSAEELAFAQRRLGRGGWDPVKEKEASATRYQRRQRTLIGLAVAVVATVCLGIVFGGWAWWLAGIAGVITTVYLVALRSQVRREQELLRRRVYHLRRARLGVRNAENPAESLPPNLRRPGALVLEIDDESPDFDYLPVYDEDDTDGDFDGPHSSPRQRRDDLAARRVG